MRNVQQAVGRRIVDRGICRNQAQSGGGFGSPILHAPQRPAEEHQKHRGNGRERSIGVIPDPERQPITGQRPDRRRVPGAHVCVREPAGGDQHIPPGEMSLIPPDEGQRDACAELKNGPELGERGDAELRVKRERKHRGHGTIGVAEPTREPARVEEHGGGRGQWLDCVPAPLARQQQTAEVQQEDVAEQNPGMILASRKRGRRQVAADHGDHRDRLRVVEHG